MLYDTDFARKCQAVFFLAKVSELRKATEKCLQAWDVRGRSSGWDALAVQEQEEHRAFWERWGNVQTRE